MNFKSRCAVMLKNLSLFNLSKELYVWLNNLFNHNPEVLTLDSKNKLWNSNKGTLFQPGFKVNLHVPGSTPRVFIGMNCVLGCSITLEREIGEVHIGDNTYIGRSSIICANDINIGSDVLIAWGVTIVDHDSHSLNWEQRAQDVKNWREGLSSNGYAGASLKKDWSVVSMAPINIGDKVWIGFNVIILKGITIGEGAVVAAGSVVTKNIAPWTLVGGNPAIYIKTLSKPD